MRSRALAALSFHNSAFVDDNSRERNRAFRVNVTAVPEPANVALMLAGVGVLALRIKRRQASSQA